MLRIYQLTIKHNYNSLWVLSPLCIRAQNKTGFTSQTMPTVHTRP